MWTTDLFTELNPLPVKNLSWHRRIARGCLLDHTEGTSDLLPAIENDGCNSPEDYGWPVQRTRIVYDDTDASCFLRQAQHKTKRFG
ncbi:hypothetical protein AA0119_g11464 [Alternaria tenuissima]|uniref:Uncharacterized protein n=1 Tax=Alternaria tenuissima TaxID=119927 RepID=A0ABY0FU50_9PLEO|nr:hypothetical protein AA0119_g11464 [Alternaria tenuissima]RYO05919.1 hypothetical protein AA0121_g12229 [Alternaria tenuissima]